MSAKNVLDQMRLSDGESMANTIPPTKRGRRNHAKRNFRVVGESNEPYSQPGHKYHRLEPDLVSRDHCCGIHGAARERKGIKKGTSSARRRLSKEIIQNALGDEDASNF